MGGWICLWRELIDKPIWVCSTPEQKTILITLLCMVNHEPKEWEWQGKKYVIQAGQMITSLENIAKRCGKGITTQNVRTALKRFETFGFLTSKSTNKNRLVTIANWRKFQERSTETNKQTNKQLTSNQQAANKQLTTNNNINNNNNNNNDNKAKLGSIEYLSTIEQAQLSPAKKRANMPLSADDEPITVTEMPFSEVEMPFSTNTAEMPFSVEQEMPFSDMGVPSPKEKVPSFSAEMPLSDFPNRLRQAIDYNTAVRNYGKKAVDTVVDMCADMVKGKDVVISGKKHEANEVAEKLLKIDYQAFTLIIDKLTEAKAKKPRNPRRYYQAIIYATMSEYVSVGDMKRSKFQNYAGAGYDHATLEDKLLEKSLEEM